MKKITIFLLCFLANVLFVQAQTYQEYYERGIDKVEANEFEEAEQFFKEALRLEPANAKNALIFSNLGTVQRSLRKYDEAIESYTLSLNIMPHSIPVLLNRASVYLQIGEVNRALIDYNNVLEINSEQTEALLMRAYIRLSRNEYESARMDYEHLLHIDPSNYNGRLGMVTLEQLTGSHTEALARLQLLLNENTENAELYIARANLQVEMGHVDMALLDLDEAINLDEDDPTPYYIKGEIYLSQKKNTLARQYFEKAISLGYPASEVRERLRNSK